MKQFERLAMALVLAWYADSGLAGSELTGLRHDPFARPDVSLTPAAAAQGGAAAAKEWKPQLRAVVVAGRNSMVNVDGTVVTLGGQFDGFRLAQVEERKAVFVKDGVRVELTMDGEKVGGK